ncbi:DUF2840 domain-containing protein [Pelagibacterium lentulum]|uniref:Glycosidase n=1 Tax=Pelagibacterium lentulum TaxID=2029865 RepID=A0A916VXG1_9HYPH|nr:DUF2840 domain-containing protein [Pelagibacterium lentulum]GGA48793.1 hypothetical protein GCM10011499_18280 [Pelagibacterium lentulum]
MSNTSSSSARTETGRMTHVELTWQEKRIEFWIRFGNAQSEQRLDRHRRIVSFGPNTIFAFVRWAANDYGTVISRIDIVRTTTDREPFQTLPFVRPGGEILLKIQSWQRVERVLSHIDSIEALDIDPTEVAPDHWRHVHSRVITGLEPRTYTFARHQAWLKRRSVGQ